MKKLGHRGFKLCNEVRNGAKIKSRSTGFRTNPPNQGIAGITAGGPFLACACFSEHSHSYLCIMYDSFRAKAEWLQWTTCLEKSLTYLLSGLV